MRHFLLPPPIARLSRGMRKPTRPRVLPARPGRPPRRQRRRPRTVRTAIPMTPIAARTDQPLQPATRTVEQAHSVHRPPEADEPPPLDPPHEAAGYSTAVVHNTARHGIGEDLVVVADAVPLFIGTGCLTPSSPGAKVQQHQLLASACRRPLGRAQRLLHSPDLRGFWAPSTGCCAHVRPL